MGQLKRWMTIFGFRRGGEGDGLPLINPAIPRKQVWTLIAIFAVVAIVLAVLHHTIAPWL